MNPRAWLWLACLWLFACQPAPLPAPVYLVNEGKLYPLQAETSATPLRLAAQAGLAPQPADRFLLNGQPIPADFPLPAGQTYTLQRIPALHFRLQTPQGETNLQSTAATVAEALAENGYTLRLQDFLSPPPHTPLSEGLRVEYRPAQAYRIRADGVEITAFSSGKTVGQALASAGIALFGLDYSLPPENSAPQAGELLRVVRVSEALELTETEIPYTTRYEYTTDLPLGAESLLTPGEPGLKVSRVRVRYEDGQETARTAEAEQTLRLPQEQVLGRGTQVMVQSLQVGNKTLQYWRAVSMYATSYSPCGTGTGDCSYGTASGLPVQYGVVAFKRDLFNALRGSQVYVEGYGFATVADVGGGFPDGRLWIDLGYSDADYVPWSQWVTVYFLAPAPAYIPAALQ